MSQRRPRTPRPASISRRNILIERAVRNALEQVDYFIGGGELVLPSPAYHTACDELLDRGSTGTTRVAMLFFMFYWIEDPEWDRDRLPSGYRGKYGDKLLSEELTRRDITMHDGVIAFGENAAWKGNVRNTRLLNTPNYSGFLSAVGGADEGQRRQVADYLAQRFAASRRPTQPLPPIGADLLTFARAKILLHALLGLHSDGHIQQFLIAALLHALRARQGIEVSTHHPHAADRFDKTAGDIEERQQGTLVRAYEVTMRDDWQHRISTFRVKMDRFSLPKYVIIASGINNDPTWGVPAAMASQLDSHGRDIAVVDIRDVVNYLAAELSAAELRAAVNKAYDYLCDPHLSGREDFKVAYRDAVGGWLDATGSDALPPA